MPPTAAHRLAHDLCDSLRLDRRVPDYDPLVQAAMQVVRDEVVRAGPPPGDQIKLPTPPPRSAIVRRLSRYLAFLFAR